MSFSSISHLYGTAFLIYLLQLEMLAQWSLRSSCWVLLSALDDILQCDTADRLLWAPTIDTKGITYIIWPDTIYLESLDLQSQSSKQPQLTSCLFIMRSSDLHTPLYGFAFGCSKMLQLFHLMSCLRNKLRIRNTLLKLSTLKNLINAEYWSRLIY